MPKTKVTEMTTFNCHIHQPSLHGRAKKTGISKGQFSGTSQPASPTREPGLNPTLDEHTGRACKLDPVCAFLPRWTERLTPGSRRPFGE